MKEGGGKEVNVAPVFGFSLKGALAVFGKNKAKSGWAERIATDSTYPTNYNKGQKTE